MKFRNTVLYCKL